MADLIEKRFNTFLIVFLCMLLVFALYAPFCQVSGQAGSGAISSAQSKLNSCYGAAKEAEAAGANITSLQDTLNTAGALLSKAELASTQNDAGSANSYAQQAESTLGNFVSEANSLRDSASQQTQMSFLLNVVASIVGAIAIAVGSIVLWLYLKRKNVSVGEAENKP